MSREEMEDRRMHAAELLHQGAQQAAVARECGVSRTTASRWARGLKRGETLRRRRAPGRPRRVADDTLLRRIWDEGGVFVQRSSLSFARAIEIRTGVHYDRDHVGRILKRLGLMTLEKRRRTAKVAV